jgi:hypothetical protein
VTKVKNKQYAGRVWSIPLLSICYESSHAILKMITSPKTKQKKTRFS